MRTDPLEQMTKSFRDKTCNVTAPLGTKTTMVRCHLEQTTEPIRTNKVMQPDPLEQKNRIALKSRNMYQNQVEQKTMQQNQSEPKTYTNVPPENH